MIATLSSLSRKKRQNDDVTGEDGKCENLLVCINEDTIIHKYGRALREVIALRDTYVTQACDICEQLRPDLSTLAYFVGKQGFGTEKMDEIMEHLYQNKTRPINTVLINLKETKT